MNSKQKQLLSTNDKLTPQHEGKQVLSLPSFLQANRLLQKSFIDMPEDEYQNKIIQDKIKIVDNPSQSYQYDNSSHYLHPFNHLSNNQNFESLFQIEVELSQYLERKVGQYSFAQLEQNQIFFDEQENNLNVEQRQNIQGQKLKLQEQLKQDFNHIMKRQNIIKKTKKTNNFTKFLIRYFLKFMNENKQQLKKHFEDEKTFKQYKNIESQLNSQKTKNIYFNNTALFKLFGQKKKRESKVKKINRSIMTDLIKKTRQKMILYNKDLQQGNKLSYLIKLKVYRLRCRYGELACRTQFREKNNQG